MAFFTSFLELGSPDLYDVHSKKGDAVDLRDFCPINLVGSIYKLLIKVLAND